MLSCLVEMCCPIGNRNEPCSKWCVSAAGILDATCTCSHRLSVKPKTSTKIVWKNGSAFDAEWNDRISSREVVANMERQKSVSWISQGNLDVKFWLQIDKCRSWSLYRSGTINKNTVFSAHFNFRVNNRQQGRGMDFLWDDVYRSLVLGALPENISLFVIVSQAAAHCTRTSLAPLRTQCSSISNAKLSNLEYQQRQNYSSKNYEQNHLNLNHRHTKLSHKRDRRERYTRFNVIFKSTDKWNVSHQRKSIQFRNIDIFHNNFRVFHHCDTYYSAKILRRQLHYLAVSYNRCFSESLTSRKLSKSKNSDPRYYNSSISCTHPWQIPGR